MHGGNNGEKIKYSTLFLHEKWPIDTFFVTLHQQIPPRFPSDQRTRVELLLYIRLCFIQNRNRRFPQIPQQPAKLAKNWITNTELPPTKLYSQLCCLEYLQNSIHPINDFKQKLKDLLKAHPNVDTKAMGFPENWEKEELWK